MSLLQVVIRLVLEQNVGYPYISWALVATELSNQLGQAATVLDHVVGLFQGEFWFPRIE